jgi:hypothetical protein
MRSKQQQQQINVVSIHNFRNWCCHLYSSCRSKQRRDNNILTILRVSVDDVTQMGGYAHSYAHLLGVYLAWYQFARYPTKEHHGIHHNLGESAAQTLELVRQLFMDESMNRTRAFELYARFRASLFLASRQLFTNNLSWQAKQSILHVVVTFYGDCMKICENFASNFGDKRTGSCSMTTHRRILPFWPANVGPKIIWLSSPTHPTLLCYRNLYI